MVPRYLKTCFTAIVSLLCLISAGQNLANLERGYQAVAYTTSMQAHTAYPVAMGPGISISVVNWAIFSIIILCEAAAGILAAKGAWDLWTARTSAAFNASKANAQLGIGAAVLVWFGLFAVAGSAYFGMWQTSAGAAALTGSFQYAAMCGVALLFVSMPDDN